jgi:hypothetical protein
MPAGIGLGYVYFAATMFLGYTAFCQWAILPQVSKTNATLLSDTAPVPDGIHLFEAFTPADKGPGIWMAGARAPRSEWLSVASWV